MATKRSLQDHSLRSHNPEQRSTALDSLSQADFTKRITDLTLAHGDYTVAWLCALPLEMAAARAMLDDEHGLPVAQPGDDNTYVLGRISSHNIVMACLPGIYGKINAAIVSTHLKRSFPNIKAALMVGIGGGAPGQANLYLGDVVVGTRVMEYDLGKATDDGVFESTADPKLPSPLLRSAVTNLRSKHGRDPLWPQLLEIQQTRLPDITRPVLPDRLFQASYKHPQGAANCDGCDNQRLQMRSPRHSREPWVHYGVIASGDSVVKDAERRDTVSRELGAVCFEMEAAGIMDILQCLPIRGICDYSDSHKNKHWQEYAAAIAAAYARELLNALSPQAATNRFPLMVDGVDPKTAEFFGGDVWKRRVSLMKDLEFPEIDGRKAAIDNAHARTCQWIVKHPKYQDWLDSKTQALTHGFLWVRGKAGVGKSTLMKFMYTEALKTPPGTTVLSFFFNARGGFLESSIAGMYRSLLVQLLRKLPALQTVLDDTEIVPLHQEGCPSIVALKGLFGSAIMQLGQHSLVCFIDALDECDEQEVRDMVQFFEDLVEDTTDEQIKFRVCFSSRPYPYIEARHGLLLTLEEELGHAEDLAQYVKRRLRVPQQLHEELSRQILNKSSMIFIWVVLVVEILNKESSHGGLALRRRLSEVPRSLGQLFKDMLTRDQHEPDRLRLCILWILCAKRPLSPDEFRHAIWASMLEDGDIDERFPTDIDVESSLRLATSSSKGLVEVTSSRRPIVQFIHESVRDFLLKERGLQELWPELGFEWEGTSHEQLRRACETYLNHPVVHTTIYRPLTAAAGGSNASHGDRHGAGQTSFDLRAENEEDAGNVCTFLGYASQNILHHANLAAPIVPQNEFLDRFLSPFGLRALDFNQRIRSRRYGPNANALYVLGDRGHEHLVRAVLDRQGPVTSNRRLTFEHPLFAAIARGHQSTVAAMLRIPAATFDGVELTYEWEYKTGPKRFLGRTPLSWASQEGKLGLVKALVRSGADVNEMDSVAQTPLERAAGNAHVAVVRFLIESGCSIQGTLGSRMLLQALTSRNAPMSTVLAAHVPIRGSTGHHVRLAAEYGFDEVVRCLVQRGADVNFKLMGKTPLGVALDKGHMLIAELLESKGALK